MGTGLSEATRSFFIGEVDYVEIDFGVSIECADLGYGQRRKTWNLL